MNAINENRKVGAIQAPSLVDLAAAAIRNMVLSGELAPGERLREEHIAEQLGISRPPLREALRLLQSEGLVAVEARRGARVTPVSEQDGWEIATLRNALERFAMEIGIPVRDGRRLLACESALERMQAAATSNDRAALTRSSFEFHLSIVALAGHSRLLETYRSLYLQMHLCMAMNVRARERRMGESLEANVRRHRSLLGCIRRGNLGEVLAAFRDHGERTYLTEFFTGPGPNSLPGSGSGAQPKARKRLTEERT